MLNESRWFQEDKMKFFKKIYILLFYSLFTIGTFYGQKSEFFIEKDSIDYFYIGDSSLGNTSWDHLMDSADTIIAKSKENNFIDTLPYPCSDKDPSYIIIFVEDRKIKQTEWVSYCLNLKTLYLFSNQKKIKKEERYTLDKNFKIQIVIYDDQGTILKDTLWYPTGEIKSITARIDTIQYYHEWYKNGQMKNKAISSVDFYSGGKLEEWRWWENGQLLNYNLSNYGKQQMVVYDSTGKKVLESTFIDMPGLFNVGTYTEWWPNGQKYVEWQYKDGNTRAEANYKIGTWNWWDESGNLVKQEFYKNNKLVDVKEYLPKVKEKEK